MGIIKQPLPIKSSGQWPFGSDGSLVINSGEVVRLLYGSIKDYSSITINAGGVLEFYSKSYPQVDWDGYVGDPRPYINRDMSQVSILGCVGNFINNGIVKCNGFEFDGASYNITSPDGSIITGSIIQSLGGNGGGGSNATLTAGPGGPGTNGYGGGGGGGGGPGGTNMTDGNGWGGTDGKRGHNTIQTADRSGLGMYTRGHGLDAIGGAGEASRYGGNGGGSGGGCGNGDIGGDAGGGGGGGGGMKGLHGCYLWIKIKGSLSGSGLFNLSGSDGFNGGSGYISASYGDGGNGGGGAGGSGGILDILTSSNQFSGIVNVTAGVGGSPGTGSPAGAATAGQNGINGSFNMRYL